MTDTAYYLIDREHAAPIIEAIEADTAKLNREVEALAGQPITSIMSSVFIPWKTASIVGVKTAEPLTTPGWRKGESYYLPNKRTKAGRHIEQRFEQLAPLLLTAFTRLDALGVDVVVRAEDGWPRSNCGVQLVGGQIVLTAKEEWPLDWPDWVHRIKASEYHLLLEEVEAKKAGAA